MDMNIDISYKLLLAVSEAENAANTAIERAKTTKLLFTCNKAIQDGKLGLALEMDYEIDTRPFIDLGMATVMVVAHSDKDANWDYNISKDINGEYDVALETFNYKLLKNMQMRGIRTSSQDGNLTRCIFHLPVKLISTKDEMIEEYISSGEIKRFGSHPIIRSLSNSLKNSRKRISGHLSVGSANDVVTDHC